MSLPRFFLTDQIIAAEQSAAFALRLDANDVHHMRVLRLSPGEHIAVIDASSDYFECEIIGFDEGCPIVSIASHGKPARKHADVILVQGLAKGDKMDTVVRHATELGVSRFIPLVCERSVVKLDVRKAAARRERWQAIAKSAAMQSGRDSIPVVEVPTAVSEVASALSGAIGICVCWEEADGSSRETFSITKAIAKSLEDYTGHSFGQSESLSDEFDALGIKDGEIAVVVGPEGGFTPDEVDVFLRANSRAHLVSLGDTILRTETAGVVACALAIYALGGLGASEAVSKR